MRLRPRLTVMALLLAGLTIAVGVTTAFASAFASYGTDGQSEEFERAVWLKPVGACTASDRGRMVNDLVEEHLRAGMPTSRIRALLGAPDETADGYWFYNVSAEYGGFLSTCVGLSLDLKEGRLLRAVVTRDD